MPDTEENEMNAEYDQAIRKQEVQEIHDAQEAIRDVLWWKQRLDWTGWIFYIIGFVMWAVQDNDRAVIIIVAAIALLLFNGLVNGSKLRRRRIECQHLLDALMRKNALPFYHQLQEKFADQPHLHIHLEANGSITITDRTNKGIK